MRYFKYKLANRTDVVLDENEHKAVQQAISDKYSGLLRFRNNTLGFDTSIVKEFFETHEGIEAMDTPALNAPSSTFERERIKRVGEKFTLGKADFYKRMGWDK